MKFWLISLLTLSGILYAAIISGPGQLSEKITSNIVKIRSQEHASINLPTLPERKSVKRAYASTQTAGHKVTFLNDGSSLSPVLSKGESIEQIWQSLNNTLESFPTQTSSCREGKEILGHRLEHAKKKEVTVLLARQWTGHIRETYCRALPARAIMIPLPS